MSDGDNICGNERIKAILNHFGISYDDLSKTESFSEVKNNPNTRKAYGLERIMRGAESKKVRIVIDYDADFPEMIIRVFSKDSLREEQEDLGQIDTNL